MITAEETPLKRIKESDDSLLRSGALDHAEDCFDRFKERISHKLLNVVATRFNLVKVVAKLVSFSTQGCIKPIGQVKAYLFLQALETHHLREDHETSCSLGCLQVMGLNTLRNSVCGYGCQQAGEHRLILSFDNL